ncbi:MAG: molecular chaperone HtpG [Gammaproteobacteria bacterium]
MTTLQEQTETLSFQTEVKQLLHLVTHSLYSNKEVFLRELVANAADAIDKLRFAALSDAALYENDSELKIWVDFNEAEQTITVRDNGIGMSREEVIDNLGTIAKSGTREFLKHLTQDQAKDSQLIGQFGVGFYSAFVVANKVIVKTRRAGMQTDQGVYWESNGEGEYTVRNIEQLVRGTEVILHLKPDEKEFLDHWRLRHIITKYSDHLPLPIVMKKIPLPQDEKQEQPIAVEDEVVNRAQALWTLSRNEIKDEEYQALYGHIAHDSEPPLLWSHNKVEGKLEYISLLYIPSRAPFDLWQRDYQRGLKLYVRRVFIMDNAEQLLPGYLRFVKGVIDANDLPLNVSREKLQNNKMLDSLRIGVTKRVLTMLENLAQENPEKYAQFWQAFGSVLKEGPGEDYANRDVVANLLRFTSTHTDTLEQTVSLQDYVARMKPEQKKIYYVTADSFAAAKNSPHLEIFRKRGIEVLLLSDRIDEWLVAHLTTFADKPLQSVAKGELDTEAADKEQEQEQQQLENSFASLIKRVKETLGEQVKDVRLSKRLTDSPACLVADEQGMSIHLQRLFEAAGQSLLTSKPILELNPQHPLLKRLKAETNDNTFKEWGHLLFEQALIAEGGKLEDPAGFVKRLNQLMLQMV